MVQRGVAGAEVVERDAHAQPAQLGQARRRADRLGEHDRLGDLEAQGVRRDAGLREQPGDRARRVPSSASCAGERLTETRELARRRRATGRAARSADSSIHSPIGTIRPFSSASGTNSAGEITPQRGCVQRSSASRIAGEPSSSETTG